MQTDPQAAAAAWSAGLAAAGPKIAAGIAAVQVAPGAAAARQKAAYTAGVAANVDKWARNVSAVSLQDWKDAATNKGVQRIASGATAAQPKMAAAMAKLLPVIASTVASLPPRGGLEQNINRSALFARAMAANAQK